MRDAIRLCVCVHVVALLTLPKDSFGMWSYRPEDFTGVLILALCGVLAATGGLTVPAGSLTTTSMLYLYYFLLVVLMRDVARGHVGALVFWFKELSYVGFGYLIWWGFRTDPGRFLSITLLALAPNLVYGVVQIFTGPQGIYGVSPFGHGRSPASSGMLFFGYSILLGLKWMSSGRKRYATATGIAVILVLASGSKIAVLGTLTFWAWYFLQGVWLRRDRRTFHQLGWFMVLAMIGLASAAVLARNNPSWRTLNRYEGFLQPIAVLAERGIWWKVNWIDSPLAAVIGAGYSPGHLTEGQPYSYSMAMDNQVLYYLVTGGVLAIIAYVALMMVVYRSMPAASMEGRVLRSLVASYAAMGLGGEVMQLSVPGNLFWLTVGICLLAQARRYAPRLLATGQSDLLCVQARP